MHCLPYARLSNTSYQSTKLLQHLRKIAMLHSFFLAPPKKKKEKNISSFVILLCHIATSRQSENVQKMKHKKVEGLKEY
jgi:hypothetical protein